MKLLSKNVGGGYRDLQAANLNMVIRFDDFAELVNVFDGRMKSFHDLVF